MTEPGPFTRLREIDEVEAGPPCSAEQLEALEQQIAPFRLTLELREMFTTFDGYPIGDFFVDVGLPSIDEALEISRELATLHKSIGETYPPALFPVFRAEGMTYSTILAKEELDESPLVQRHYDDTEYTLAYQSLRRFAETLLRNREIGMANKYSGTVAN